MCAPAVRGGSQEPRVRIEPPRSWTEGDDAADLLAEYGFALDPWQRSVLDCWLGRDASGRFTVTTAGLSVPRQNGKNGCIEALEFYMLVMVPGTHILHTAHQVKTAKKAFRRLCSMLEDRRHPEIAALVANVRRTNGEEQIEMVDGSTIEYSARTRGSARGFDGITLVVYDEAQELQEEHVEALMATMAASKTDRQLVYLGTPPGPGCVGTVFANVRKASIKSPGPRTAWHEWGVEEIGDVWDRDRWYASNPALGIRLTEEFTEEECRTMTPDGFARERLGWWAPDAADADRCVDAAKWDEALTKDPPTAGVACFAVKYSPDGRRGAVAACLKADEGPYHVELVARTDRADARWAYDVIRDALPTAGMVAVDGRAHAEDLKTMLRDARVPRRVTAYPGPGEVADACSMLSSAVDTGRVTHYGQRSLTESVTGCIRRRIGREGWGFDGRGQYDETYAEAAALAYWAARKCTRDPRRKAKIG